MTTKSGLAIRLSRLERFTAAKPKLEQYESDSEIAAEVLWNAHLLGDIEGKRIADLGAGTGVLGIGALELGAEKAYLVEKDPDALAVLKRNTSDLADAEIIEGDISGFKNRTDTVIQNPPFGTKEKHADRPFLEKAFGTADVVYSFHKESTRAFVEAIAADNNYEITHHWKFAFPLRQTHKFHTRKTHRIEVGCWRMKRKA